MKNKIINVIRLLVLGLVIIVPVLMLLYSFLADTPESIVSYDAYVYFGDIVTTLFKITCISLWAINIVWLCLTHIKKEKKI